MFWLLREGVGVAACAPRALPLPTGLVITEYYVWYSNIGFDFSCSLYIYFSLLADLLTKSK